jgi:pyruvate carboxylase
MSPRAASATPESGIPVQDDITLHGHAMQCRITTEDPDQNFIPDYGRITAYRGATGFGIRLDGGTAYSGAVITRFYDPLLGKGHGLGADAEETRKRMDRALREFRIRGVATNLTFLENVIGHPSFIDNSYTTRFIDETPELFEQVKRQDRATKLLTYIADVTVNGHPETKGRPIAARRCRARPHAGLFRRSQGAPRQKLDELGPEGFADWMKEQKRVLITDTTMRDGHQSCSPPGCAHDIASLARRSMRARCRNFCRWNAGAGRPSTCPCGS